MTASASFMVRLLRSAGMARREPHPTLCAAATGPLRHGQPCPESRGLASGRRTTGHVGDRRRLSMRKLFPELPNPGCVGGKATISLFSLRNGIMLLADGEGRTGPPFTYSSCRSWTDWSLMCSFGALAIPFGLEKLNKIQENFSPFLSLGFQRAFGALWLAQRV